MLFVNCVKIWWAIVQYHHFVWALSKGIQTRRSWFSCILPQFFFLCDWYRNVPCFRIMSSTPAKVFCWAMMLHFRLFSLSLARFYFLCTAICNCHHVINFLWWRVCVCAMSSKHTRSFIKMKRSAFLLGHSNIRINCMTNTEIAFGNVVNGDKSDINMRPLLFQSVSSWWRVAQQHLY